MEDSFSSASTVSTASAPAAATSTDAEAERKAKTKAARSARKTMQREREKANKELPLANGVAPFVRVNLEDRHGDLPRGPGGVWTHTFECASVANGCGYAINTDEGFVMSYGVSTWKRLAKTSEFVANRRQLVSLGRAHGRATNYSEDRIPGPPIESEDGRGNMWYSHEQRNVIGYPVPVAAHIDGKIVHLDSDDRCIEARRQGHFFYAPSRDKPVDAGIEFNNMYWRQPLATQDLAYDAIGVGKLFYSADPGQIKVGRDYNLDMTMMPMTYTHMGAWQLIDMYDARPYWERDMEGAAPMYGIGGPKELRAHTDDPFWHDRGLAPKASADYANAMHNRYNDTFRQFHGVQIGDWCPLLGTDAMLFQERMLWIVDGAGAAGVVPHDLLWMLLPGYQPLMWLPSMDAIGMDTQLRREQMTFDPTALARGCNTCGPATSLMKPLSDQKRVELGGWMAVLTRPVANPYRDFGQAAAIAAIATPIARAQSAACAPNITGTGWFAAFVKAAERYGLMRDAPAPKGTRYTKLAGNKPNKTEEAWRCAEQMRIDGVHPLLRRGADEAAHPLYLKQDYGGTFLMSYFPEATNVDLARLSPSFMFTMFGLRRPRVLSPDGVSPTHLHNMGRQGVLYSKYARAHGGFWQLPVDATRCEARHPRHYSTLVEGSYLPEQWATSVGGPLWWDSPHAFADASTELLQLLADNGTMLHEVEALNRRFKKAVDDARDLDQKTERWFPFPRTHPQLYRDVFQSRPDQRLRCVLGRKHGVDNNAKIDLAYESCEMVYISREAQAVRQHARGVDGWYSCFDTHRSVAQPQSWASWNAATGIEPGIFCTLSERNALDGGASARGLIAQLAHFHMASRVDPMHARGLDWAGTQQPRRLTPTEGCVSGFVLSIWDRALVGAGYQLLAPGTAGGVALGEAEQLAAEKRSFSATHVSKWVPRQAPTLRRALLRMPAVLRNAFDVPTLTRAPPPTNRAAAMLRTDPINPPADEVWAELLRARALKKMPRSGVWTENTPEAAAAASALQEADLVGALNRGMPMAAFRIGLVALPEWIKMRRENEFPLHSLASPTRSDVVEPFSLYLEQAAKCYGAECANDHLLWMTVPRDEAFTRPTEWRFLPSRLGTRQLTKDAEIVAEVAKNLICGLAAEFGVVLAGVANELSPYAEARVAWRAGLDKSASGQARAERFSKTWKHVCMNISMTYTDPNLGLGVPTLAANPFVTSGAALVAFAVEREVDPAAYAACLELLQLGEAALDVNERSVDEDPAVAWRARLTLASMTRRGGTLHLSDATTTYAKDRHATECAALARVRELLVPPSVRDDSHWARRLAAQRNWCIGASENVTVPCWPDFDVPLDGPGARRATEDTHRYLILRRHLHSWLGDGPRFNAVLPESSPLIFGGLHRQLTEKIPDLHVDYEPVLRREAAKAVLREIHSPEGEEAKKAVKRYHVKLPDTADRWWLDAAHTKQTRRHNPYQTVLHGPIGTALQREVRHQFKRDKGAHLESDAYREAFHDRLRGIADAVVRVAAAVVLEGNVGELRWYVGSVTVLDDGRLPRQRVHRRNRWVAVTDEDEAAPAMRESLHPAEEAAVFFGSRIASAGGVGTGNAGDGALPLGSASEEARRTRLAVLRVREPLLRAQRILHTRTILKPQLHAALLDKKRGLLTRTKERHLHACRKVALHAEFSDLSMVQAESYEDAETRLREGMRRRRELAEMR